MPDTASLSPRPHHSPHHPRHGKEPLSPGRQMGGGGGGGGNARNSFSEFPEYLKHVDPLESGGSNGFKISPSNTLFQAVIKGRLRNTEYLLDHGTAVNGRNNYGFSVLTAALHIDSSKRRAKMFQMLLDRGADPLFTDAAFQRNVLHWACVLGRTEQVESLLTELAIDLDLRAKDAGSYTALHHAVMTGQLPVVTMLVDIHRKFGVSVDLADNLGLTPYLHAKRLGHREVAQYLHSQGMASLGHGDTQFRTPREWSMIGKFERQRASDMHTLEAINNARIQGGLKHFRSLENTPRDGVGSLMLPRPPPSNSPRLPRQAGAPNSDRLTSSLPSLQGDKHGGGRKSKGILRRPSSANGAPAGGTGGVDSVDSGTATHGSVYGEGGTTTTTATPPEPPREAFVHETPSNPSSSTLPGAASSSKDLTTPNSRRPFLGGVVRGGGGGREGVAWMSLPGIKEGGGGDEGGVGGVGGGGSPFPGSHRPSGPAAFTLMEMNAKGRHASTYRQSQFDETKASEYKHMMSDITSFMDILSQQQSRSFRKSVKYQRPETPKKVKTKQKVSSLAVILGRENNRRNRRRSAKKNAASSRTKGSAVAGAMKKEKGAAGETQKGKAADKKKPVPVLKVNDKAV